MTPPEPCEICGTPILLLEVRDERVWVHLVTEASDDSLGVEEWQEHRPEQCQAIRNLLTMRRP